MELNRRTVLIGGAAALVTAGAGGASMTAASAATTVNMEAVLLAAQWDPRKASSGLTPGAKDSVLAVERALVAKGLLKSSLVDGHFGSSTVSAYAAWQRRLGYSGLGANGIPGPTSLTKLGTGRFTVTRKVYAGSRLYYDGVKMNERTKAMLREAERILAPRLSYSQGSYNAGGVTASAGTHDGGGAVDISAAQLTPSQRTQVVKVLRQVGFAAWLRTPAQADWGYHIHAIAVSDPDLSSGAQHQVGDYYLGLNGLAGRGPDDGPQVTKVTWEQYKRAHGL
jgi:peptidoglycan hydrolase-like protein with peptidoglycan-binding domain